MASPCFEGFPPSKRSPNRSIQAPGTSFWEKHGLFLPNSRPLGRRSPSAAVHTAVLTACTAGGVPATHRRAAGTQKGVVPGTQNKWKRTCEQGVFWKLHEPSWAAWWSFHQDVGASHLSASGDLGEGLRTWAGIRREITTQLVTRTLRCTTFARVSTHKKSHSRGLLCDRDPYGKGDTAHFQAGARALETLRKLQALDWGSGGLDLNLHSAMAEISVGALRLGFSSFQKNRWWLSRPCSLKLLQGQRKQKGAFEPRPSLSRALRGVTRELQSSAATLLPTPASFRKEKKRNLWGAGRGPAHPVLGDCFQTLH